MYTDTINMKLEHMRTEQTPMVLYNTLFNIVNHRTDIEGFWMDSDGEVYRDNIEERVYFAYDSYYFRLAVQRLIKSGEKAVFYKNFYNHGVIEHADGTEQTLRERVEIIEQSRPSEEYIAELLKRHEGFTLYKLAWNCYVIEIYK